jgi:hypothetical protein
VEATTTMSNQRKKGRTKTMSDPFGVRIDLSLYSQMKMLLANRQDLNKSYLINYALRELLNSGEAIPERVREENAA